MNAKMIMLAVAVAVIGAGALMMCDDSDAVAGSIIFSGTCGDDLTYKLISLNDDNSELKLSIEGSGGMNFASSNVPWKGYMSRTYEIQLPEGLTDIQANSFENARIATIDLPAGLTRIGGCAFRNCTNLTYVEFPENIEYVGNISFSGCPITAITMPIIDYSTGTGLSNLQHITISKLTAEITAGHETKTPMYSSRASLQSITFPTDYIPAYALYGQNLDTLTITNASGPDVLGIYTAPNVKATASALTVDGTTAQIVRLTDVRGAAELVDGGITANDVDVHWDTSPDGYATGEVDASPEVLVYPAGTHTSAPNQYAGLINAIPLIVIVAIITTIIGMMAVRRD